MRVAGRPRASHIAREAALLGARHRDQHPARGLGEQRDERIGALGKHYAATGFAGERRLDHGLRQTALGQVVGRGHQAVAGGRAQHLGEQLLAGQVDRGRQPAEVVGGDLRPDRAVELVAGVAEQDQRLARLGAHAGRDAPGDVVDDAEHPDDRGGQDRRRRRSGCRS